MKNLILAITIFLLIIGCSKDDINQSSPNPFADSVSTVKCVAVIDGDTWKFEYRDHLYSVRVLGIDCFETSINTRLEGQASDNGISVDSALTLGLLAKHLADSLMYQKDIIIVRNYRERNFDIYERLLRYCYINGLDYKEYIISRGLSAK